MARIHEIIDQLFGHGLTEEDILEAFRCDHPGFTAHPMAQALNNGIYVHGDFNTSTADASYVGYFKRQFYRDGSGVLAAHHIEILVCKPYRKQGLAKTHLAKLLAFYDRVGIEYVHLDALGYGSIVWPQLGFELREPGELELLRDNLRSIGAELGYDVTPPQRTPSIALSEIDGHDIGLEAVDRTYRALGERPIPMVLDLKDEQTRAFLDARGILPQEGAS